MTVKLIQPFTQLNKMPAFSAKETLIRANNGKLYIVSDIIQGYEENENGQPYLSFEVILIPTREDNASNKRMN